MDFSVKGNVVDINNRKVYAAEVVLRDGRIQEIKKLGGSADTSLYYMMPGFVDAHVHIESSMLVPSEFARLAIVHGTVATVSDPHEIANVCGMLGVAFMIENGKEVPFKFNFGAPSCVPTTPFETAGATLDVQDVEALLAKREIKYLSEMMNFPGVLDEDSDVVQKIRAAHRLGKPVDGHAPGLRGEAAKKYIDAGISTDHECFTAEEALGKLQHGMKILIREGSAAKNFEALIELMHEHFENMMFCTDDMHPDSLVEGHINKLCARAVAKGVDVFKVLQAACINPVQHYKLEVGLLNVGDAADFILVKDLKAFEVVQTYVNGELVAVNGVTKIQRQSSGTINEFNCSKKNQKDFETFWNSEKELPVIEALDGQLITNRLMLPPKVVDGKIVSDIDNDILKIVVVNRYNEAPVAKSFIRNFGFARGAIASTVAHDSHNIVAIGVDDESLMRAVNLVIEKRGGVSCVDGAEETVLALPVAGLMSAEDGYAVARQYSDIDAKAKALGSQLSAPFMTLSFMALLVIPHLKLSDKGLFDGDAFSFIQNV